MENNQSKLEKNLLKELILNQPNRPGEYTFSRIYRFFDYQKHSEDEIKKILKNLVDKNILIENNEIYSLTRDSFFQLKTQYKYSILLSSEYSKFIIPFIVAIIASLISAFPDFEKLFIRDTETELNNKLEQDIKEIEKKLNSNTFIITKKNNEKTSIVELEIQKIKKDYLELSENVNSLNSLLEDNPRKFVEIAAMKRDIEDVRKEINSNNESLKREVDRISSYNNTLIAFMITFLVAYIGLGIFNLVRKNDATPI
ncbi:hypothetical protein [Flavobacterium helocola]|uniref:Uncharacterized protein n=1 Tax=Flavobacterium helocola TaxID=3139139 RepID=A0ABU9I9Z1_9FLAO